MREFVLERSPISVETVGKLSTRAQTLFSIREFIQERNPTNVMNVGSPSGGTLICATSSERSPMSVMNVGRPSVKAHYLSQHLRIHSGENPVIYKECGKPTDGVQSLLDIRGFVPEKSLPDAP